MAKQIYIFIKAGCGRCSDGEILSQDLTENEITNFVMNIMEAEALSEFAYFALKQTPSVVLYDNEEENPIKIWEGNVPSLEEILKWITSN